MKIEIIAENDLKKKIAEKVLTALPKWFGIKSSLEEYISNLEDKDFFVATVDNNYVGFFAVEYLKNNVASLYVLGILEEYHNMGVGTQLLMFVENHLVKRGIKYITVQTLSNKSSNESYTKTRKFYEKHGFICIYENDKIWGENNPFMLMVKYVVCNN